MKSTIPFVVLAAALLAFSTGKAQAQVYSGGYAPNQGYVYYPPTGWAAPPPIGYYPGPYFPGYGLYYQRLRPYGFGSPYYNGYNDPYYYSYGPGLREFLRFGGADFYGW